MKLLEKILKGKRKVIFFDLEGTQITQEIIAIAAVKAKLDAQFNIKKIEKNSFKKFVIAKGDIGYIVEDLTGITEETILFEGIKWEKAIDAFKNFIGRDPSSYAFIAYGNYDKRLFNNTCHINDNYGQEIIDVINENYIDFAMFLNKYIKGEKGNSISLSDAVMLFGENFSGKKHDPLADTLNLAKLFDLFGKNLSIVKQEYKKTLLTDPKLPQPIYKILKKLGANESVTPKDFQQYIDEFIN